MIEFMLTFFVIACLVVLILFTVGCSHNWRIRGKGQRECFKCGTCQTKDKQGCWVDD